MAIDTREELIIALQRASEIEHALLVQYLYAAISMKKSLGEGLTAEQQKLARDWQAQILLTARDEMGHLAIVCNLLAAIGAPAKFDRPAMPRKVDYYPFAFDLIPFSDEALYRFLVFELPRGSPLPPPPGADLSEAMMAAAAFEAVAPEPLKFTYVGELYAQISDGFARIDEAKLFIGPPEAQTDNDSWSDPNLDIQLVRSRDEAIKAIENIIVDGEGSSARSPDSHYNRFLGIREAYFHAGRFEAARPLARNPATRADGRTSGEVKLITDPNALHIAELFNSTYGFMLMLLQAYFTLAPKTGDPNAAKRLALQLAAQRLMSVAIRPLAEELTLLPLGKPADPVRAGPPFEIYSDVTVLPYEPARWTILLERFDALAAECSSLGAKFPRIGELGETLSIMAADLRTAFTETAP